MTKPTPDTATCRECSLPLTPKRYGPPPTYCSTRCRTKAGHRRAKEEGRTEQWRRNAAQKYVPVSHQLVCWHCRETFTATRSTSKYCSQQCKNRAYNAQRKEDGRLKTYREEAADKRNAWMAANRGRYEEQRTCAVCAGLFICLIYKPTRLCSPACDAWEKREQAGTNACRIPDTHPVMSSRIPSRHPVRRRPGLRSLRQRWYSGQCQRCGVWFVHDQPATRACSKRCLKRLAQDLRRARQREAMVEPVYRYKVFERDEWTCQLCGLPVDREAEVPSPLAPTVDHIIPLAKGGTHEPSNAQCAHFICNSTKCDRLDYVIITT